MEEKSINLGVMFGFLKEENGHVAIANRMFEMCLMNMFMAREAITSEAFSKGESDSIQFIKNNMLDMTLVLKKFVEYFHEIYSEKDADYIEKYGRKFFLLYLKPISTAQEIIILRHRQGMQDARMSLWIIVGSSLLLN